MKDLSTSMRTSVLETLTLLASDEKQREYQRAVPHVAVPAELFNQWEDCYVPRDIDFRSGFTGSELDVLAHFHEVFNHVCAETPQELPALEALEEFLASEAWRTLSTAARDALSALAPRLGRGSLPVQR